jgi:hypothetical protein
MTEWDYGGVVMRTIACVGKKLGWEKGFGVDTRCYYACRFENVGRLEAVVDDDCGHHCDLDGRRWLICGGGWRGHIEGGPRAAGYYAKLLRSYPCLCSTVQLSFSIMFRL